MVTRQNPGRRPSRPRKTKSRKRGKAQVGRIVVAGILAVALVAFGGWLWNTLFPPEGGHPEAACYLLIDRTSSAADSPASVDHYRSMADTAILGCADQSALLLIGSFTQNGTAVDLATHGEPADAVFHLYEGEGRTESKRELQREDGIDNASDAVDKILSSSDSANRNSDVLTAIDQASTELQLNARDAGVDSMHLVILTDGIQISDSYSFSSFVEGGNVPTYVEQARAAGNTPEMSGITVDFVGVGGGARADGDQLPSWFEDQMEQFWTLFVDTAGGSVCYYGPDPSRLPVAC